MSFNNPTQASAAASEKIEQAKKDIVDHLKRGKSLAEGITLSASQFPLDYGDALETILDDAKRDIGIEIDNQIRYVNSQTFDPAKVRNENFSTKEKMLAYCYSEALKLLYRRYGSVQGEHLIAGAGKRQNVVIAVGKALGLQDWQVRN